MTVCWRNRRRPSATCSTPAATMRSGRAPPMSRPSSTILPAAGRSKPEIARSVVLLPAPLLPTSATIDPRATSSDTRSSTPTWP